MSVIRWLVVQEVCRCFEFARHFVWPGHPPFICACEQRFPMNIPLSQCYSVHVLYSQPIRLNEIGNAQTQHKGEEVENVPFYVTSF